MVTACAPIDADKIAIEIGATQNIFFTAFIPKVLVFIIPTVTPNFQWFAPI